MTDEASLEALAARAAEAFGPVHVVSANAGVIVPQGPLAEKSSADWAFVFSVNLFGIVKTVQAFLPGMRAHGEGGHFQNTASMAGLVTIPDIEVGIYGASKYACVAYCEQLRAELAPEGIGVSVLCPGMVASNLSATSAANRPDAFGGPGPAPAVRGPSTDDPQAEALGIMSAETCGRVVADAIRENRLHIVTHPESWPLVEARFEAIRRDYQAEEAAQRRRAG